MRRARCDGRSRNIIGPCTEFDGDAGTLAAEGVALRFGQRRDKHLVHAHHRVGQRDMNPAHQIGIVSRIRRARGERASRGAEMAVDARVNRPDRPDRARLFNRVAECHRAHRADGVMQAPGGRQHATTEGAVVGDGGGHERMRELKQNRARPAQNHGSLAIDAAGNHGAEPKRL